MSNAVSIRKFVENYENGVYDELNVNMIDSIWHDRQVTDRDIQHRTKPLAKKVMRFLKVAEDKVDMDKNYVFFRNVKPTHGDIYDTFTITEKDQKKVIFFICPKIGHEVAKGKAQLLAVPDDKHLELFGDTYGKTLDALRAINKAEAKERAKLEPEQVTEPEMA
ncbi:hypothetical protein Ab1vBOLIVR5_gp58c [Agrobacterium phage OLIVR5]|uniref:Uncharacterized protein n=1 Tax=Agrobacterium phage OLIVR5 TaxID=2723773 RepID=A0A858MSJ5_9CAUD|nr:hypothetical protein KNU99_gp058 [Agrobacterium phage OLIVR5]QIW87706.1 hypothetical protein Ab1vBOLIVR5_gp58c [Agrobacterium phage OLIVR5]QIW87968.1 hypothetical protein Ab1vBOLIVR6_gp61c [Agrobacterium phage OLIVR6]